jgi:hypothetical protein
MVQGMVLVTGVVESSMVTRLRAIRRLAWESAYNACLRMRLHSSVTPFPLLYRMPRFCDYTLGQCLNRLTQ